jgi:hypothetical protein
MKTELEENWLEDWNVNTLFPELFAISVSPPMDAYKEIKRNRKVNNLSLAEIVDAAWWCMYGLLYSTEDDRYNAPKHDTYFYGENNFKTDVVMMFKCESMRVETGSHRYPIPKKGNNTTNKKKTKRFKDYRDFVVETTMSLTKYQYEWSSDATNTRNIYKAASDMARCSQERLIGNDPDVVANERRQQYIAIGGLLDDVFVHRGYVRKIQDEGAEMLTPEQLDEWESVKRRISQSGDATYVSIPGFVREMVKQPSFMLDLLT